MMPFYGDVDHFRVAVESVLRQTDPAWRLVVIDDRYPGSAQRDYLDTLDDERVEYVLNPENLGVAGNFQRAVDLARASHVVIMGCDDVLLPSYVARMAELIQSHPEAALLQPGVRVIDDAGRPVLPLADRVKEALRPTRARQHLLSGESMAVSLLRGVWTYFPSIAWQTDVLREHGFRPEFEVVLDLALLFDIAISDRPMVVDTADTFLYRRHRASVSSAKAVDGSRFREERSFFREAAARSRGRGWSRAARAARHHLSSRLNAVTQLPRALRAGDRPGVAELARHITSGSPNRPAGIIVP